MSSITLINTVHAEAGLCTVDALHRALEILRPDVVFEEIPPASFDEIYTECTRSTLESDTVKRYLKNHPLEHIPVDDETPELSFFEKDQRMHRAIEGRSREYRRTVDWQVQYKRTYGFPYLNSEYSINLNREFEDAINQTLEEIGNDKYLAHHKEWNDVIEKRENTMLRNIYDYCRQHKFDRGVFFIGAAHRESFIEKIQAYEAIEPDTISWNYSDYDGLF
jgi:hypothetical protein